MKIIIACGGTGGHVFPALATAQKLVERHSEVVFVGSRRAIEEHIRKSGYALQLLPIGTFSFCSPLAALQSLVNFIKSIGAAFSIIRKEKPDSVIGFGGYISVPVVLSALVQGIPVCIHEQNVILGKANRLMALGARKIALSFFESARYFKSRKTVLTGCPLRSDMVPQNAEESFGYFNFESAKPVVLVLGGSQGSHVLNIVFTQAFAGFARGRDVQVIHISGKRDYAFVCSEYERLNIIARVFEFLEEMRYAYTVADIVISRSGASTIAELAAFGKASILVPYPFAGGHQRYNAEVLASRKAALVIEEADLTPGRLQEALKRLIQDNEERRRMELCAKEAAVADAAGRLADEVIMLGAEQ